MAVDHPHQVRPWSRTQSTWVTDPHLVNVDMHDEIGFGGFLFIRPISFHRLDQTFR
jgi:hypothetical protein